MDKKIKKKNYIAIKIIVGSMVLGLLLWGGYQMMNQKKQVNLKKDRLTIKKVRYDYFEDMVLFNSIVEPLNTILINTIESGAVQKVYVEDGKMVVKGEPLVEIYNPNTELNYLTRETAIIEQINNLRNTKISIENQQLSLDRDLLLIEHDFIDSEREYQTNTILYGSEIIPKNDYKKSEEDYRYQQEQKRMISQRIQNEKTDRSQQLKRLNASIAKMEESLAQLRANKENFIIKATASGQLSSFDPVIGASYTSGETIGKIDLLDGYKMVAMVDEYYTSYIAEGLKAVMTFQNQPYDLVVSKVLSEVKNGKFEVELLFQTETPEQIKRGMSLPVKIYLSEQNEKAILLPKGGFYQSSGGQYVFVVNGNQAEKRAITIGKTNPYYYEVLDGLKQEDVVIISSYDHFKDMELLNLE